MNNNDSRIINLDSEYKIKIETGIEFENSIFSEVYKQARQNVADILSHSEDKDKHGSYNNIIAFTGERGKGKSSTMISFLESLVEKNSKEHKYFYSDDIVINRSSSRSTENEEKYNILKEDSDNYKFSDFNFLTIDVIDPSSFRREEQLFEIIIAKLFLQFRENIQDKNGKHVNDEDRRELVKLFQMVFDDLKSINNRNEIYKQDALDALIKLSTSSNLKDSFDKLIQKYLAIFGSSNKTNFLIIAIDDFDLKIDGVYEMLEDIRQYLITENIIILIACKMEQLTESIFLEITRQKYKDVKWDDVRSDKGNTERQMTSKVIEKLIPIKRQVAIPSIDDLVINGRNDNDVGYLSPQNKELDINIISEICKVFDVFISKNSYYNNVLFPQTMREHSNLEAVLNSRDKNIFHNYILSLLREQNNTLYELYNTKNYTNRTTVISHFIVLLETFYRNNEFKNNELNTPISKVFSYTKIENFIPSILFTLFILLDEYIDKRNTHQFKTLELLKILYDIDYNKQIFPVDEEYKNCYFIQPEMFPPSLRIDSSLKLRKNRDIFPLKLTPNIRKALSPSEQETNNLSEKELLEKYKNSSFYSSRILSNNKLESASIVQLNDNFFSQIDSNEEEIYWVLFFESFGSKDFLEREWEISKYSAPLQYIKFNLFQPLNSLGNIRSKKLFLNQPNQILLEKVNDDLLFKLLNNLSFVTELYKEMLNY